MLKTIIATPQPFDFHLTASHQTYFRSAAGADLYTDGVYWRALRYGEQVVVTSVTPASTGHDAGLEVSVHGDDVTPAQLQHAADTMRHMLGLDVDLVGFYRMLEGDAALGETAKSLYGMCPPRTESVFEALIVAIASQQIAGAVARLIRDSLVSTYGSPVDAMAQRLYAFPTPRALLEAGTDGLRALRLSTRKTEYIQDVCLRTLEGSLSDARLRELDNDTLTEELLKIRGVGHWTSVMVQLRALGRPDVFPAGDVALAKVISQLYFGGQLLSERQLADFAKERWHPYEGLATTYLYAHLRQQRIAAATP